MTLTDEKIPHITRARLTDRRTVLLGLANCPRMHNGTGTLFMPDTLLLQFTSGELVMVELHGRRLREDGAPWLDGRRTSRKFLNTANRPFHLDEQTPVWIRDLIRTFTPTGEV